MSADEAEIVEAIQWALAPGQFFARHPNRLQWVNAVRETVYWELYHGRALDAAMTRDRMQFRAWNILIDNANEPLISVKWDFEGRMIHVTRSILCYTYEPVASGNVIETREITRRVRELVGTIPVDESHFRTEIAITIHLAVTGTSRLPLNSLEAPLPEFSLGDFGYAPTENPKTQVEVAMDRFASRSIAVDHPEVRVKQLELTLRAGGRPYMERGEEALKQLREVFLCIALSPYTSFFASTLTWLRQLQADGRVSNGDRLDFLCWLLRLQWRHLNAYDLLEFHHRGANYPDALLIDETLRESFEIVTAYPLLATGECGQVRRRSLRLGWLLRMMYAGCPVPAQPTSPGENLRALPEPHIRVPDEQILQLQRRPRRLFTEPLECPNIIADTFDELNSPDELQELGTALMLDRPFGQGKAIGEPDATPLVAHVVFSRQLIQRNLEWLQRKWSDAMQGRLDDKLLRDPQGIPLTQLRRQQRPGVVSIDDCMATCTNLKIVRTTKTSIQRIQDCLPLSQLITHRSWFIVSPTQTANGEAQWVYDDQLMPWLEIRYKPECGWSTRHGRQRPAEVELREI